MRLPEEDASKLLFMMVGGIIGSCVASGPPYLDLDINFGPIIV